uniref:LRRCT domain-containing protein n=1 Tax=Steinernema glaseri TaxID=37863 RepID=A0A1I7ZAX6_9BILA
MAGLPLLQHLHLSSNQHLFSKCHTRAYNDCWIASIDQLTSLIELDLSNTSLIRPVNLSAFTNLRTIDLSNNVMTSFDARLLPPCVAHLNLKNNLLHFITNFSAPTVSCLHEIDVADNPLLCDCSLSDIAHLLMTLPHIADRSHYYCFASNWQHPLLPYLANIHSCSSTSLENIIPMFVNFALFLIAFGILLLAGTFFMSKMLVLRVFKVPFLYKPLATSELVAEL